MPNNREADMKVIRDALMDGHPNPEGYLEWCDAQSDERIAEIAASCGQETVTVAAPKTSQQSEVGSMPWVEELAKSWERRASAINDRQSYRTLAEVILEQSFKERAEELRRAYAESSSTATEMSYSDELTGTHATKRSWR